MFNFLILANRVFPQCIANFIELALSHLQNSLDCIEEISSCFTCWIFFILCDGIFDKFSSVGIIFCVNCTDANFDSNCYHIFVLSWVAWWVSISFHSSIHYSTLKVKISNLKIRQADLLFHLSLFVSINSLKLVLNKELVLLNFTFEHFFCYPKRDWINFKICGFNEELI